MSDAAAYGATGALIAGGLMTVIVAAIAVWVIFVIAYWRVFNKMGEPGWKCIIPVYNEYIVFKRTWSTSMFWIYLIAGVLGAALAYSGIQIDVNGNIQNISNPIPAGIGSILVFVSALIQLISYYYLSKSFGHGVGYFLGLIFLSFIFVLVIGFGSSRYIGPKGEPMAIGNHVI